MGDSKLASMVKRLGDQNTDPTPTWNFGPDGGYKSLPGIPLQTTTADIKDAGSVGRFNPFKGYDESNRQMPVREI